ncbi:MAG TPA: Jag N-terminal domain-containing protein, partial [Desulfopila sp.]|nr:Jag N-terminal domain-containing protein [Desulfopila sp.]
MTSNTKDFYGKEVTDAIKNACDKLQVPQEQLEIEVVETGSTGIFGLIRKKAHIRACVKKSEGKVKNIPPIQRKASTTAEKNKAAAPAPERDTAGEEKEQVVAPQAPAEKSLEEKPRSHQGAHEDAQQHGDTSARKSQEGQEQLDEGSEDDDNESSNGLATGNDKEGTELPESTLALITEELQQILELMGYPSAIEISASGTSVLCQVSEEHEAVLTGQDGKTLDSLQYLLRKIIARKVPERLRLSVDVGNYRQKRLDELKVQALEMAGKVKEDGKTQVIAALSPSERRVIHMSLQEDKEIRSRSVGDGL